MDSTSTIPLLSKFQNFHPQAIFCTCTAQFVSDLFRNHIAGFLMTQLKWPRRQDIIPEISYQCCFHFTTELHVDQQTYTKLTEPPHKTNNLGFRRGPIQTSLYSHRSRLEALNFGFMKKRDCSTCAVKTKTLISFAVYREAGLRLCFRICKLLVF